MAYLALTFRWGLAVVFLAAAVAKLRDRRAFEVALIEYGLRHVGLRRASAKLLPPAELLLAVALAVGLIPRVAGAVAAVVLLTFASVVSWNVAHGKRFACGCGGREAEISWSLVAKDTVLCAASVVVAAESVTALAVWRVTPVAKHQVGSTASFIVVPMCVLLAAIAYRLSEQTVWPVYRARLAVRHQPNSVTS
jgi:uncharacterized membrane protein YphA (DoxX/SURF4 family)